MGLLDVARLGMTVDTRDLDKAEAKGKKFSKSMKGASKETKNLSVAGGLAKKSMVGLAAGLAAVLGATASIGASIRDAREFTGALAEVSTLIEGTPEQMSKLESAALRLTSTFGGNAQGQVKAFYQAISAGAGTVDEAIAMTEAANKLAIGGVTNVETAMDGLTSIFNAYKSQGITVEEVSDAMFIAMKGGKTTIGELSGAMGRVASIASSAGIGFDELAAGIATITTKGINTNEAVTGMKALVSSIIAPTAAAKKVADELGVTLDQNALKTKGLQGIVDEIVAASGGNVGVLKELLGSVEAVNAALAMSNGDTMTNLLDDMKDKAGATDEAYTKMANNLDQRLVVISGKISAFSTKVGNVLLKGIVPIIESVFNFFDNLGNKAREFAEEYPNLTAVIIGAGNILIGIFGGLWEAAKGFYNLLTTIFGGIPKVADAAAGLFAVDELKAAQRAYDAIKANIKSVEVMYDAISSMDKEDPRLEILTNTLEAYRAELETTGATLDELKAKAAGESLEMDVEQSMTNLANLTTELERYQTTRQQMIDQNRFTEGDPLDVFSQSAIDDVLARMEAEQARLEALKAKLSANETANSVSESESELTKVETALTGVTEEATAASTAITEVGPSLEQATASAAEQIAQMKAAIEQVTALNALVNSEDNVWAAMRQQMELEIPKTVTAVNAGFAQIKTAIESQKTSLNTNGFLAGIAIFDGFIQGMESKAALAKSRAATIGREVAQAARDALKIRSPSRVFWEIGKDTMEGWAKGLKENKEKTLEEIKSFAQEAADSVAGFFEGLGIGELLTGQFEGIDGFFDHVLKQFQSLIANLINTAIANPIRLSVQGNVAGQISGGLGGSGGVGGGSGGVGGGGLLGGLRGIWGTSSAPGFFGGTGFLGLKGGSFSLGGLLGAAGAVFGVIGLIGGIAKALKRNVKDRGITGSFGPNGFTGQQYTYKGGNLLRGASTSYSSMDPEMQKFLDDSFYGIRTGVLDMAKILGVGAEALDEFSYDFKVSLFNLDREGQINAITGEIEGMANAMAEMILGTEEYTQEGETAVETLTRLATSFTAVNASLEHLGLATFEASLASGAAASNIIELVGGLNEFQTLTNSYYENFYNEAERLDLTMGALRQTFSELGYTVPESRLQFRQLVEALDLTTAHGQLAYATMLSVADAFASVTSGGVGFSSTIDSLVSGLREEVSLFITDANLQLRTAQQQAQIWGRVVDSIENLLSEIRNTTESIFGFADTERLRNSFQEQWALAMGGDIEAAQGIGSHVTDYMSGLSSSIANPVEYMRQTKLLQIKLEALSEVAQDQESLEEQSVNLLNAQLVILQDLLEFLELEGVSISDFEDLDAFMAMLNQQLENFGTRLGLVGADIFGFLDAPIDDLSNGLQILSDQLGVEVDDLIDEIAQISNDLNIPLGNLLDGISQLESGIYDGNGNLVVAMDEVVSELVTTATNLGIPLGDLVDGLAGLGDEFPAAIYDANGDVVAGISDLASDLGIQTLSLSTALEALESTTGATLWQTSEFLEAGIVSLASDLGVTTSALADRLVDLKQTNNVRLDLVISSLAATREGIGSDLVQLGNVITQIAAVTNTSIADAVELLRTQPQDVADLMDGLVLDASNLIAPLDGITSGLTVLQNALVVELVRMRSALESQITNSQLTASLTNMRAQLDTFYNLYGQQQISSVPTVTGEREVGTGASWVQLSDGTRFESFEGNSANELRVAREQAAQYIADQLALYEAWQNNILPLRQQIRELELQLGLTPSFARGIDNFPGGSAWIAEAGPELVAPNSSVYSAGTTRRMLDNSEIVAELRQMKSDSHQRDIADAKFRRKLTKDQEKIRKVFTKWDIQGLPTERD